MSGANFRFVNVKSIMQPVAYTSVGNDTLRKPFKTRALVPMDCVGITKVRLPVEAFKSETEIVDEESKVILPSWLGSAILVE